MEIAYYIEELRKNEFARSTSLARLIKPLELPELRKLLEVRQLTSGNDALYEVVYASKHDTLTVRPGFHLAPHEAFSWASICSELEEYYWYYAAEFDDCVFQLCLTNLDSHQRKKGIVSATGGHDRFLAEIPRYADKYGYWTAQLDIQKFYEKINGQVLLRCLGPEGLKIEPRLVDKVSAAADRFSHGLPQGSISSHLVARLILTNFDRHAKELDLGFLRFVDNVLLFAESESDLQKKINQATSIMSQLGFQIKRPCIERPERLKWVKLGIDWGEVPIELYESESEEIEAKNLGTDYESNRPSRGLIPDVDWPWLFADESDVSGRARSERGHRLTLRSMAGISPQVIVERSSDLTRHRPSDIPYLLSGLRYPCDRTRAGWKCFSSVPNTLAKENDRFKAIDRTSFGSRSSIARRWLAFFVDNGICPDNRSTTNGILDRLPRGEDSIGPSLRIIGQNPWLDTLACVASNVIAIPGTGSAIARDALETNHSNAGLLFDLAEQARYS